MFWKRRIMENKIIVPAQLTRVSRRADRSVSLGFVTGLEISSQNYMLMDTFYQSEGWLLFKENEIKEEEVPEEDAEFGGKTQAQRLRGVLYRVWESTKTTEKFEDYYKAETERIIEHYKQKI